MAGFIVILVAAAAGLVAQYRPDRAIRVAAGYVAHSVCVKTFVSGFDPQTVFAETLDREGIRRLRHVLFYQLDRNARTVDVSALGLFRSHMTFHEGFGCVEQHGARPPYLLRSDIVALKTPKAPPVLPDIAGPAVVEPSDPALK